MAQGILRLPTDGDRRRIQEIIDRHLAGRPEGLRRIDFRFDEDHTGYPAVYIDMFVDKDLDPNPRKIEELNGFVKILHNKIINSGIGFWPYSRTFLEEE